MNLWLRLPLLLLLALPCQWAQADTELVVHAEAGPEIDTNVTRSQKLSYGDSSSGSDPSETEEGGDPVAAGLMRMSFAGQLGWRPAKNHLISVGYGGGSKLIISDNARALGTAEAAHHGSLSWTTRIPAGALSLEGSFYDSYQRTSFWDLRNGTGFVRLSIGHPTIPLGVTARLGYRGFQHKPSNDYSFHGPLATLGLSSTLSREDDGDQVDWTFSLSYSVGLRRYLGDWVWVQCPESTGDPCLASGITREDLNHVLRGEVGYLGNAALSIWYELETNRSNSHGETFTRHMVGIRFTTELVWGFDCTTRGKIQLNRFRDTLFLRPETTSNIYSLEDENRSSLELQLARDLTSKLSLYVRYVLYVNESVPRSTQRESTVVPGFLRHTLFGGLRFEYSL
jgi:hypothetical protein